MKKLFVWFFFFVGISLKAYGSSLRGDITTLIDEQSQKIARRLQEDEAVVPQISSGPILPETSAAQNNSSTSDNTSNTNANSIYLETISDESTNSTQGSNNNNSNQSSDGANHTVIIVVAIVCAICIIGLALLLLRIRSMRNAQLALELENNNTVELNSSGTGPEMRTNESFQVFDRRNDSVIINVDNSMNQTPVYKNKEIL